MKTPEEIKCGMECIRTNAERICVKPEKGQCPRCEQLVGEALVRIRQLEQRLAQVERERDAMLLDMQRYSMCGACKRFVDGKKCPMYEDCDYAKVGHFEWRGVCEDNSKEENNG